MTTPDAIPETGARVDELLGLSSNCLFFAPESGSYAANPQPPAIQSFKHLVKALHEAGIEIILDVVFNHTGEGDDFACPTWSYRALWPSAYLLPD